jgi:hypothetical protein
LQHHFSSQDYRDSFRHDAFRIARVLDALRRRDAEADEVASSVYCDAERVAPSAIARHEPIAVTTQAALQEFNDPVLP